MILTNGKNNNIAEIKTKYFVTFGAVLGLIAYVNN